MILLYIGNKVIGYNTPNRSVKNLIKLIRNQWVFLVFFFLIIFPSYHCTQLLWVQWIKINNYCDNWYTYLKPWFKKTLIISLLKTLKYMFIGHKIMELANQLFL